MLESGRFPVYVPGYAAGRPDGIPESLAVQLLNRLTTQLHLYPVVQPGN